MAKNSIADWSTTAAQNTDVGGVGITGNSLPSNLDDAIRTVMAQIKTDVWYTGNLVKTTSATDTTAGRMLKVADFGIGGQIDSGQIDYDTAYYGFSANASTATYPLNNPLGITTSRWAGVTFGTENSAFQLTSRTDSFAGPFFRVKAVGVWGVWRTLYHNTNILGTVSQSGGTPTGAVIERGSNANGEYVRYADGTQECWHSVSDTTGSATASGSIFDVGVDLTWTFPAAFSSSATVGFWGTVSRVDRTGGVSQRTQSATAVTYRYWTSVSLGAGATMVTRLRSVGRWY